MAYAIDVIRFNLISNFFLFFILIVLFFLAVKVENDNNSILYPINPENLWCYPDVHCQNTNNDIEDFTANFELVKTLTNNTITDQNIIFASYDGSETFGTSLQTYNIYWNQDLPPEAIAQPGLEAGYYNYSNSGTSIYLKYYNNVANWNKGINNGGINKIFTEAYQGTSANILNQANLTSIKNTLQYKLINPGPEGLSIRVTNLDGSDLTDNNFSITGFINLAIDNAGESISDPNTAEISSVMEIYANAIKSDIKSKTTEGTSIIRCIDPSFATEINCSDVIYDNDLGGYYLRPDLLNTNDDKNGFCKNQDFNGNLYNTMKNNNCATPFCTNGIVGGNASDNIGYKSNDFATVNNLKSSISDRITMDQYNLNNKPLTDTTSNYGGPGAGDTNFNNSIQAQSLLFCAGTSILTNNFADNEFSKGGSFPVSNTTLTNNTPYLATQPNARKVNNNFILGFK